MRDQERRGKEVHIGLVFVFLHPYGLLFPDINKKGKAIPITGSGGP
jgi:hypothetical protein